MRAAVIALLLLAGACSEPLPEGREVDVTAASELVLDFYGFRGPPPHVYLVPDSCGEGVSGFLSEGVCRGGMTIRGAGVWLVETPAPQNAVDLSLAHELRHWMGHDHAGLDWSPESEDGRAVAAGEVLLAARPGFARFGVTP